MDSKSVRSPKLREALRKLGNPYACEQVYEVAAPTHDAIDSSVRAFVRRSENPYASLGVEPASSATIVTPISSQSTTVSRISKADFRAAAQRIFRCYIPATEKGVLRQHYKDFISRNEVRSAEQRAAILNGLRNYDISELGMSGQFNRERDDLTVAKLVRIEELALGNQAT